MDVVGYRFTPYSVGRGYRRKGIHIYHNDVVKAANKYLKVRHKLNVSIIYLNIHTVNRKKVVSGKDALSCFGELIEGRLSSKKIRFKVERIIRKPGGKNVRRKD